MERRSWWLRLGDWCRRTWADILDVALIVWVTRVPTAFLLVGMLVLGLAPQAQDLLVELADEPSYARIPLFFLLLFMVWAVPTHYAARLLLDTDARYQRYKRERGADFCNEAERLYPRFLGFMTFIAVFIAFVRSYTNVPDMEDTGVIDAVKSNLRWFAGYLVVLACVFLYYVSVRRSLANTRAFAWVRSIGERITPYMGALASDGPDVPPDEVAARNFARLLLIFLFLGFVTLLLLGPLWTAETFPRALAVPLVLGGWLPLLAYVSALGRRLRAPLILGGILALAALGAILGDRHTVRRVEAAAAAGHPVDLTPLRLEEAVRLWRRANNCSEAGQACPRPIIVAGAGGASRAGFFTASVIGHFLQMAGEHGLDAQAVRNRLFAISAISGSAVGAAMTAAAFAATPAGDAHPCRLRQHPLWFGGEIGNWRDCLEALMSGDFITPVFVGLSFYDPIRLLFWQDRATMLEQSWDRHFAHLVPPPAGHKGKCWGLDCPFMMLKPSEERWLPLLVLNGVSVGSGQRILTTPLDMDYTPLTACPTAEQKESRAGGCRIFSEAQSFHDFFADEREGEGFWARLQNALHLHGIVGQNFDDIPLSTAAHNSARFPVISPAGAIRNRKHQVVDRIVDGGYFENYGALTAKELADAIRAVDPALAPFVLVASNDPDVPIDDVDRKPVDVDDSELFTLFWGPVNAIAHVRNTRGTLAVAQLRASLFADNPPTCNVNAAHVRVLRQKSAALNGDERTRAVSMSWWLSRPIQNFLHQHTEETKAPNQKQNLEQIAKVWTALRMTSDCRAGG